MLKTELMEIIANGENSGVEFKRDDIRPEQLAREAVAFTNLQGGRILLGVEDDGTITGLRRDNPQEWVLNTFRDKIHPQIIPFYEEIALEGNTRVGVVSVSMGISKPYVLRHNKREEIYIRMGDRSELATREQQARLFQAGNMLHVEALPVAGTTFQTLDKSRLEDYLTHILKDPAPPKNEKEWLDRVTGLGFLTEGGQGGKVCSIAGLVCFGVAPRRFLKQAGIRLMAFEAVDKQYQAKLDEILDAPLVGRWEIVESGERRLVDDGLIEKLASTIKPFTTREAAEFDENFRREPTVLYPQDAIREAVINALAHRDWTLSVDVEVTCYSNRMEIVSPGKLQNSMTVTKMIAGQRLPRNPLIMDVLRDYNYVDARGMGVRTKIIPSMRLHNNVDPIFEATEDFLRTILPQKADGIS